MNSLNIVSRLTSTPPPSPPRSRTNSIAPDANSSGAQGDYDDRLSPSVQEKQRASYNTESTNEKTPLLSSNNESESLSGAPRSRLWRLPSRITEAVVYSVKLVLTALIAPGRYVVACFYDEHGHFSAVMPFSKFKTLMSRRRRKQVVKETSSAVQEKEELQRRPSQARRKHRRSPSIESTASTTSVGSSDNDSSLEDSPSQRTRSKTAVNNATDGESNGQRSSKVKLLDNEQAVRNRHKVKTRQPAGSSADDVAAIATSLKSPTSASTASRITRYPRAPAPPRPLVPRRQPSYSLSFAPEAPRKTLIIDLDETLIHSMARGGRMSTGHMVEVRLGGPVSASGIQIGPGVPILYYVHERPGCHDFLRKVCKWFNLIVFTASVQEYADPVIDWLERERKYFAGRYYRQHCTFRNGAYIKDLAQVEPDLSKVMILDNSPMSYIFHEDNAIPIEGWISDPTDNDLLHLVPFLEGLQYVTDVRALLALRHGQAQQA